MFTRKNGKFAFEDSVPPEAFAAISEVILPLEFLLPGWCQKCFVQWDSSVDDATIIASTDYAYRRICLTFTPAWLDNTADSRREQCIHDLLHACTAIMADWMRDEIKRAFTESDAPIMRGILLDELATRHESMTQDLAFIIDNLLKISPPVSVANSQD
jgi:hypothetical protein